jgi:hypothetical protein
MAMSGMRLGETLAMRWENLDIRGCQYNITETPGKEGSPPPKAAGGSQTWTKPWSANWIFISRS